MSTNINYFYNFFIFIIVFIIVFTIKDKRIHHGSSISSKISSQAYNIKMYIDVFYMDNSFYPDLTISSNNTFSSDTIQLFENSIFINYLDETVGSPNDLSTYDCWGNPFNIAIRGVTSNTNEFNNIFWTDAPDVIVWSSGPNKINEYGKKDDILDISTSNVKLRYNKSWGCHAK